MYYKKNNMVIKLRVIQFILLLSSIGPVTFGQNLKLRVEGDTIKGFCVAIFDDEKLLLKNFLWKCTILMKVYLLN